MGVALKLVTKTETRPKYPEAPGKVTYYDNIITELTSKKSEACTKLTMAKRETYRSRVLNSNAEGPYYNEYKIYKDVWFDELKSIISDYNAFLSLVDTRIGEARGLKASWEAKSKETIEVEIETYVPVDEEG